MFTVTSMQLGKRTFQEIFRQSYELHLTHMRVDARYVMFYYGLQVIILDYKKNCLECA